MQNEIKVLIQTLFFHSDDTLMVICLNSRDALS
jgi:hypothetical protein